MTDETPDQTGHPPIPIAGHQLQPQEQEHQHPQKHPLQTLCRAGGLAPRPPVTPLDRLARRAVVRAAAQHRGLCQGVLVECVSTLERVHIPVVLDCPGIRATATESTAETIERDKVAAAHVCGTVLGLAARAGAVRRGPTPAAAFEASPACQCPTAMASPETLVAHLAAHTVAPLPVLVAALVYVDRAAEGVRVDSHSVQRLFAAAFVVAGKFASDEFNSNRHCARAAGLTINELNAAECALLAATHGALAVTPAEYTAYADPVAVLTRAYNQCGDLTALLDRIVAQQD